MLSICRPIDICLLFNNLFTQKFHSVLCSLVCCWNLIKNIKNGFFYVEFFFIIVSVLFPINTANEICGRQNPCQSSEFCAVVIILELGQ